MYKNILLYVTVQTAILFPRSKLMAVKTYAVLIADVVQSSARAGMRGLLGKKLAAASARHLREKWIKLPYSVTAGDEFQTVAEMPQWIPAAILDLRIQLQPLSLRIGIGFGSISDRIEAPVNLLGGEAFQRARAAIDSVKSSERFKFEVLTAFSSSDEVFDAAINLIYGLHDTLVLRIKKKQWQTIEAFQHGRTLQQTARRLRLDTSTISRNLKRGHYWQMAETAKVAEALIARSAL
jgi:SatD family (SatD)